MAYRKCFVPTCSNNSKNSPNKIFVRIREDLREKWCRDVGVEYYKVYTMYCCEDHFDPKNDLKNYHKHKLMNQEPRLKPTASLCYIAPNKSEDSTELIKLLRHATTRKPVKRKYEDTIMRSTSSYSTLPVKGLGLNHANYNLEDTPGTSSQNVEPGHIDADSNPENQPGTSSQNVNEDSPSGNEVKIFCPKCNTEVQHTAEGIQEDQTKILVAKVYHYFECEYEELKKKYGDLDLTPLSKFCQRTALATGVSEARVLQILKEEEERNAEKREEKKECRARKRPISTESSTDEESSDDSVSDGGQPSCEQEAQNEPDVETLVVKIEPECDKDQVQTSTIPVQVKAEPPDDDTIYTTETLATTEPAATKRKGKKIPRSDVTSTQQHRQGEPSTSAALRSVRLKEIPDESGLLGEADIKVEEMEIGDEQFT